MAIAKGKWEIIGDLGAQALLLPDAVNRGIEATDRLRYCLGLLENAERQAQEPGAGAPSLQDEREAIGIDDADLDEVVPGSRLEGGALRVPHAGRVHRLMVECVDDMLAPLVIAGAAGSGASPGVVYRDRFQELLGGLPPLEGERVAPSYVARIVRADAGAADSLQRLAADLQGELNRLQQSLSRESIEGAQVYRLSEEDRDLVRAFMAGVNETAGLRFDHVGFSTAATRSRDALLVQSDIGAAEAHLLVVRVAGLTCTAARLASTWEREADELVDRGRNLSQGSGDAHAHGRVLAEADDAADGLEEAAFLLTLLPAAEAMTAFRAPLEELAGLLHAAADEWRSCLAAALAARKRRARDELQAVLESVDRIATFEGEIDDAQRAVTVSLFRGEADGRVIQLVLLVAQALEHASDALAHAALSLRDHLIDDPMFR